MKSIYETLKKSNLYGGMFHSVHPVEEALADPAVDQFASEWMERNEFSYEVLAAGTHSVALKIDNPEYVLRITSESGYLCSPYIVHPIDVFGNNAQESGIDIKSLHIGKSFDLHIVPRLEDFKSGEYFKKEYMSELEATGCSYLGDCYESDAKLFRFIDSCGQEWEVPMGIDGNMIYSGMSGMPLIACTENYPPLSAQWEKQCEIVRHDKRLQRLLGSDTPPKLRETEILPRKTPWPWRTPLISDPTRPAISPNASEGFDM